jgi:hypothetical protein
MRLPERGRGKPDGDGTETVAAKPYSRPGHSGPRDTGIHLGTLHSPPEGERAWGCRNAATGETVMIRSKRTETFGDVLIDVDGNEWTPSGTGIVPYVP